MVDTLDMRLQSRVAGRTQSRPTLVFVLTHHLAQEIGTDDVHLRIAILSVYHAGELFQLLQHARLEILVLTELHGRFYETLGSSPVCSRDELSTYFAVR